MEFANEIIHTFPEPLFAQLYAKWEKKYPNNAKSLVNFLQLFADTGYRATLKSDEYRLHKAWSNSALTGVLNEHILNRPNKGAARAFTFGSCVHELLLEPQNFCLDDFCLRQSEIDVINRMYESVQRCKELDQVRANAKPEHKEVSVFWTDEITELPCKAKIDIRFKSVCYDIKTTSAGSKREFEESVKKYEYHRQAAFYMDGTDTEAFIFFALSKRKPNHIFTSAIFKDSKLYHEGKNNYQKLLHFVKRKNLQP
jgi:hypothetical protein